MEITGTVLPLTKYSWLVIALYCLYSLTYKLELWRGFKLLLGLGGCISAIAALFVFKAFKSLDLQNVDMLDALLLTFTLLAGACFLGVEHSHRKQWVGFRATVCTIAFGQIMYPMLLLLSYCSIYTQASG